VIVMALPFVPHCQPTSLGPLPHRDAYAAWNTMLRTTSALPALPLLATQGEALPLLAVEGLAGVQIERATLTFNREQTRRGLDALDAAYLRGTTSGNSPVLAVLPLVLQPEQALLRRARAISAATLGPVSLALTLVDEQAEPLLTDAPLLDAVAKHTFLRRLALQRRLDRTGRAIILWLYEPYLHIVESPFSALDAADLVLAVDQALWVSDVGAAMALPEYLPLDALGLPLPPPEAAAPILPVLERIIGQRGAIGWGIVPVTAEGLRGATVGRLAARFETWLRALEEAGMATADVLAASLIMPEDTLVQLTPADADRALALTVELSSLIKQSYGVE
jgi:hypothetical protein